MVDENGTKNEEAEGRNSSEEATPAREVPTSVMLAGAERRFDDKVHIGIAIRVTSSGKPSTLMIPDVAGVEKGEPIFITRRISLNGDNLEAFLKKEQITLPEKLAGVLRKGSISCEALYYSKDGPLLMIFEVIIEDGLLSNLVDPSLGELFDIQSGSLRLLRVPDEASLETLKKYCAALET